MARAQAVVLAALLAAPASAQGDALVVLLRDPSGAPVVGARGELACRAGSMLPALAGVAAATPGSGGTMLVATSDARGELRFVPLGQPAALHAGSGLVTTDAGLGALLVDLLPGRAQRLSLQPLAAVTTATGTEPFVLHARAVLPAGRTVPLPAQRGTVVRLPAGSYEAWVHAADGWIWQRLDLVAGQRALLQFGGPAQRVRVRAGGRLWPAGRPEIDLLAGGTEVVLRGAALGAPLVVAAGPAVHGPMVLPGPPTATPIELPPADRDAPLRLEPVPTGLPAAGARLFGLLRSDSGAWRLCADVAPTGEPPRFALPPPPNGDAWLLLVAAGWPPLAAPWTTGAARLPQPERGVPLRVRARDGQGLPAVDLAVDYEPRQQTPAVVAGHSDARGEARLGPVLAPGVLRVSDVRYANAEVALDAIPVDGLDIVVAPGATLRGRAAWPDGSPAAGTVVTLRDPGAALRPAQRAAVTGADGAFVFPGLPQHAPLLLFATAMRDGRTWSGRLERARPDGDPAELVLRDEDPQPPRR